MKQIIGKENYCKKQRSIYFDGHEKLLDKIDLEVVACHTNFSAWMRSLAYDYFTGQRRKGEKL